MNKIIHITTKSYLLFIFIGGSDVVESELVSVLGGCDNTKKIEYQQNAKSGRCPLVPNPVPECVLLQEFFGKVLEVTL
jgi:hypothetical protein